MLTNCPRARSAERFLLPALAIAALLVTGLVNAETESDKTRQASEPDKSGRVNANGIDYYYQVHGEGEPLLLLHGGLGAIDMFGPVLAGLAEQRRVIAVELQGHGRTALGDRPIRYRDMADDMAAILEQLDQPEVDVVGYSMGGGVGLRFAIQHPERVKRLALVSTGFSRDGFYPEMIPQQEQISAEMAGAMEDTPMYRTYRKLAPKPEKFPELLDRMGDLMRKPYNWRDEVKALNMPVMLVYGDSDMFRPEHMVDFYQLLGGGLGDAGWQREKMSINRLAVLPGKTHYDIFFDPLLARTVLPFLNGGMVKKNWKEREDSE